MPLAGVAEARVRAAVPVPDVLAAAFDAFEVIRLYARASEDREPGLFAAFMATAGAAVEGREAITIAPSLPPGPSSVITASPATASTPAGKVTASLARLSAALREQLARAAATAHEPGDRDACTHAAQAAGRICSFMAGDGDGRLW